jgi:RNA recognition motif-containing protein
MEPSAAGAAPDPSVLASKRVVYVGGISDQATEELMRAAFLPFGNIKGIVMVREAYYHSDRQIGRIPSTVFESCVR